MCRKKKLKNSLRYGISPFFALQMGKVWYLTFFYSGMIVNIFFSIRRLARRYHSIEISLKFVLIFVTKRKGTTEKYRFVVNFFQFIAF
jgi:hypothetical protein